MGRASQERLTPRQKECLGWIALGKSSWDIGKILDISENTVNFHIKKAMKKLDTNSRTVAAIKAFQLGLINVNVIGLHDSILLPPATQ
jgi:LuxR family transcriptional regulator, activator of conjugal transfer of Ti plasmids